MREKRDFETGVDTAFKVGDYVMLKKRFRIHGKAYDLEKGGLPVYYEGILEKWLKGSVGKVTKIFYDAKSDENVVYLVLFLGEVNAKEGFTEKAERLIYGFMLKYATAKGIRKYKKSEFLLKAKGLAERL